MTSMRAEGDPIALLVHLMELDHAAIEGYQIASERISSERTRERLEAFKADHERHLRELEPIVRSLGGDPPDANAKGRVLPGMQTIADLEGDEPILVAMKNNEDGTAQAYQDTLERAPAEAREIIQRACEDEQRHREGLSIAFGDVRTSTSYQNATPRQRPGSPPPQMR